MSIRDIFIKHDERRGQWRVRPLGWVVAVLAALFIASLTSGACRFMCGPQLQVTPTPRLPGQPGQMDTPTTAVADSGTATPRPTATAIVHESCPSDPALWTLVPYQLPGSDRILYAVDPPCVMEQVERVYAKCEDRLVAQVKHWTEENERDCYSTSGFTTILGEEVAAVPPPAWPVFGRCTMAVKADGTPVTSADLHIVFYTMSKDKRVADLLIINDADVVAIYDYNCVTGELNEERTENRTQVAIVYYTMLYEGKHWRRGRHDVANLVPIDAIEVEGTINMVLRAQGRLP